jgi:hypothetical protein
VVAFFAFIQVRCDYWLVVPPVVGVGKPFTTSGFTAIEQITKLEFDGQRA